MGTGSRIFIILLGLFLLGGSVWGAIFEPMHLNQTDVYNRAQTIFACFIGCLAGIVALLIGIVGDGPQGMYD